MKATCQDCDQYMTRIVIKREAIQDTYVFGCEECNKTVKIEV